MRKVKITMLVDNKAAKSLRKELSEAIIDDSSASFKVDVPGCGEAKVSGKLKKLKVEERRDEAVDFKSVKSSLAWR